MFLLFYSFELLPIFSLSFWLCMFCYLALLINIQGINMSYAVCVCFVNFNDHRVRVPVHLVLLTYYLFVCVCVYICVACTQMHAILQYVWFWWKHDVFCGIRLVLNWWAWCSPFYPNNHNSLTVIISIMNEILIEILWFLCRVVVVITCMYVLMYTSIAFHLNILL